MCFLVDVNEPCFLKEALGNQDYNGQRPWILNFNIFKTTNFYFFSIKLQTDELQMDLQYQV
jgi:hypothetical protein